MEYRAWNPFRSKLAAAILGGIDQIHIKPGVRVLYLGAASGTTVSHVSDIVGPVSTGTPYPGWGGGGRRGGKRDYPPLQLNPMRPPRKAWSTLWSSPTAPAVTSSTWPRNAPTSSPS